MYKVVVKEILNSQVKLMAIHAPAIAKKLKPDSLLCLELMMKVREFL